MVITVTMYTIFIIAQAKSSNDHKLCESADWSLPTTITKIQIPRAKSGTFAAVDQAFFHCLAAAMGSAALAMVKIITIRAITRFQANAWLSEG